METKFEKVPSGLVVVKYNVNDDGEIVGSPLCFTPAVLEALIKRNNTVVNEIEAMQTMFKVKK